MKIHYLTALVAVGFSNSLEFESVIANYKSIPYAVVLEAMLILISVHGFNGLRIILLELKQGNAYENAVTYGCLAAMIVLIAYGSRTIIMASMGMV
jgi:succinate dehydrogenase / fumarate reductase membrane anchor subunit